MAKRRVFGLMGMAAAILVLLGLLNVTTVPVAGQARAAAAAIKTTWGEPDLQGIWYQTYQVPLERAARVADKAALTEAERKAADEARVAVVGRDKRSDVGTEKDVAGAYNAVFTTIRPRGERTSLIIEPASGRLPPTTPEAQKLAKIEADY